MFLLCAIAIGAAQADDEMRLPRRVEKNARFTITLENIPEKVQNPYDPHEIEVIGLFTAPSGRRLEMPAFFQEGFDPVFRVATRQSGWRLSFLPQESGRYKLSVYMRIDAGRWEKTGEGEFESIKSDFAGLPKPASPPTGYFMFPYGDDFFPVGINYGWGDSGNPEIYLEQLDRLADEGADMIRLWLAPWWINLEPNAGRYDQRAAALLDAIIERCELNGIYVIICVEQHSAFWDRENLHNYWSEHPYNARLGGPCHTRGEFFTNPLAMQMTENKLRYIVARWGASPNVFVWELFNEVEYFPFDQGNLQRNISAVLDWHRRMARSLRKNDPYGRIISTSADEDLQKSLLLEGLIDIIQLHIYDDDDPLEMLIKIMSEATRNYGAPVLAGEYGPREPVDTVPALARGTWASMFTGGAGAGLYWWHWGDVLEQNRLPFNDIKRFAEGIRWNEERFRHVYVDVFSNRNEADKLFEDVLIEPSLNFGGVGKTCVVRRNGAIVNADGIPQYLLAPNQRERRSPLIIDVNYPFDSYIAINVDAVSDRGELVYSIDGRRVDTVDLPTGPDNENAKKSRWIEDWGVHQDVYDREYVFQVSAGRRRLKIENRGSGWVRIDKIRLANYLEREPVNHQALALAGRNNTLVYIARMSNDEANTADALTARVEDAPAGDYRIEWYDCRTGKVLETGTMSVSETHLIVDVPEFDKHIAARLKRVEK